RRETTFDLSIDVDAGESTPVSIAIRQRKRNDVWSSRFRRAREDSPERIFMDVVQLVASDSFVVNLSDLLFDFERAVAPHEFQRGQILSGRAFRQAGNRVVEDPFVIFVDAESRAGFLFRFGVLANSETSIFVDAPRQLEPELVFFPHLARIDLPRVVDRVAVTLARGLHHRLPET